MLGVSKIFFFLRNKYFFSLQVCIKSISDSQVTFVYIALLTIVTKQLHNIKIGK